MDLFNQKRKPSVQLALNGIPVYLHNIQMTASVKREEKDMSGQKSSTNKSDKGIKAKELQVSGIIPYANKEWLTDLFNLAEAEDKKGEQTKYRVSCLLAETINMREVQFSDMVQAQELQDKLAWQVSFKLKEVNSVAEKKAERKPKPKTKVQSEKAPVAQDKKETAPSQQPEQKEVDNSISGWLDRVLS